MRTINTLIQDLQEMVDSGMGETEIVVGDFDGETKEMVLNDFSILAIFPTNDPKEEEVVVLATPHLHEAIEEFTSDDSH